MDQEIPEIMPDKKITVDPIPIRNILTKSKSPTKAIIRPKVLGIIGAVVIVVIILFGLLIGWPLYRSYQDGKQAYALALSIKDAAKSQDVKKTKEAIVATKNQVAKVRADLAPLGWTTFLPFFGGYTSDAIHIANAGQYGLEAAEITF